MIHLWIDDLRSPPDDSWLWVTNSAAALAVVRHETVTEVSFDHDLGGDDTSIKVANEIELMVYEGRMDMPEWHVHSANPVGRANLTRTMHSAERFAQRADAARTHDSEGPDAREREVREEGNNLSEVDLGDQSSGWLPPPEVLQTTTADSDGGRI